MKEIEFRVWIKSGFDEDIKPSMASIGSINFEEGYIVTDEDNNTWSFNDIILLQYTGLKDKNGVKIFEGDLVKSMQGSVENEDFTGTVVFRNAQFLIDCGEYKTMKTLGHCSDLEVIGNIYENPELLKNEQ